jgi:agmatinase
MSGSGPFAGIATFLKSPYIPEPTQADGDVAVIGVPYDEGVTSRAGTREGPRALRVISANWAYRDETESFWDGEVAAALLGGVRLVDAGDVQLAPTAPPELSHRRIAGRLTALMGAGLFPVVLGGDHSITYPVLQGVNQARAQTESGRASASPPPHLVQFDSHMDYWDEIGDQAYTHASPIIRAHEAGLVSSITQYGIRGLHTASDNILVARERGVVSFWCEQTKRELLQGHIEDLVESIRPGADVWITFDIDCLDPAIAPGTGTPEPGGFAYYEAKALLLAVAKRARVIGMDLVEVNPLYDPGQLAALHGARLILDTVGAVFERRRSSPSRRG